MKKFITVIARVFVDTYLSSVSPNHFGSRIRRMDKEGIAGEFKSMASDTQSQIDDIVYSNLFEGAWGKSVMPIASSNAK